MVHLKKLETLDATLTQLEQQANKLGETSTAYTKLTELVQSYEEIKEKFGENSEALEQFANSQLKSLNQFVEGQEKSFGNFIIGQESTRGEFKRTLAEIETSNEENQEELRSINLETRKHLIGNIADLSVANKTFYTDMEQSIRVQFSENKSEMKTLIEAEREQQKELLTQALKRQSNLIFDNQKTITTILYVIGVLLLFVFGGMIYSLFT